MDVTAGIWQWWRDNFLSQPHGTVGYRLEAIERQCTEKVRYATKPSRKKARGLRPYKCKCCAGWHLSSKAFKQ